MNFLVDRVRKKQLQRLFLARVHNAGAPPTPGHKKVARPVSNDRAGHSSSFAVTQSGLTYCGELTSASSPRLPRSTAFSSAGSGRLFDANT